MRREEQAVGNVPNRTIFVHDNLPVLRGMDSASVDLVYLDPPFNSGQEWAAPIGSEAAGASFKDAWTLDDIDVAWADEIEAEHPALHHVLVAAGFAHGDPMRSYLTFMAIRLIEMQRVLKPSGSIYLHCDDTAGAYLKVLMDAVFAGGGGGFRNEIVWQRARTATPTSAGATAPATSRRPVRATATAASPGGAAIPTRGAATGPCPAGCRTGSSRRAAGTICRRRNASTRSTRRG